MKSGTAALSVHRFAEMELAFCLLCSRLDSRPVLWLFRTVSWLGDGPFWYLQLPLLLLLEPFGAARAIGHLLLVAGVCLLTYKSIKKLTARDRPCARGVENRTQPLDPYSFPSGHTLHAVAFSLVILQYQPVLAWLLIPFSVLVAMSRIVLGLHYPTDVAAGAGLGASIAYLSFQL